MRRTAFAVGLVAAALASPSATAQNGGPMNLTLAQVVANVQTLNAGTRTFSATFTQTYLAHAYNTTKTSNGSVVTSGLRADWSYTWPVGLRIVSDGTNECVYEPSVNQLYMRGVDQSQYPVVALLTQSNFASYFTFQLLPGAQLQYPGGYVLVGTPIKTAAYTKVLVYVDAQTFEIARVMFLDGQQNRNRFDFTNVQRNAQKVNATFVIYPPLNATFIGPGKTATLPATCP
jgi:outer membrane lipoprotein-sorting protein